VDADRATKGALLPSGWGAYRWFSKALVCCLQCSLGCGRRDLRSVERAVGAIPRPISYLRSDPSTLAVRQPDPFAGARKRGRPWPKHRWSRSSRPANHHAAATEGVRASYRGGEHGITGSAETPALVKPAPCPSLGGARPMLLGEAIFRAPSLHRGGALPGASSSPRKRRRPRKGYAERVVRRHGSLASSHDRKKMPVVPVQDGGLPPHQTCMARGGWKHPQRVNEVTGLALLHGRARMGERKLGPQRGQRRKLRAKEDSRLAGVPARRSCVAEIGRQTRSPQKPFESSLSR